MDAHMNPADYHLPFDKFRPVQESALEWAIPNEHPVIMLEAPPGVGKSGIGMAWAESTGEQYAVLAQTISYLDQYNRTLGLMSLKGRANFRCSSVGGSCEAKCGYLDCQYDRQMQKSRRQRGIVTTYAMYLQALLHRPTVVCDEGHRLLDILGDYQSVGISEEECELIGMDMPNVRDAGDMVTWAKSVVLPVRPDPRYNLQGTMAYDRVSRTVSRAKRLDLSRDYVTTLDRRLKVTPVWPELGQLARSRLLIMSATLYGGRLLSRLLGMTTTEFEHTQIPSPFRADRRPFYYWPVAKLNHKSDWRDWRRMADGVKTALSNHPGKKALVTVNSYAQVKQLTDQLKLDDREVMVHHEGINRWSRSQLFKTFRNAPDNTVLVSASAWEGEDFPNDQLRVHVIAKVLYPNLGDPLVKARYASGKEGKDWYSAVTCGNIAQAYGRIMRSEEDYGYTYILDSNWGNVHRFNRDFIPRYVTEAVQRVHSA